ncbi:MAG: hypothetical protein WC197_09875, partial [Candidatus Gastranaerophilaceae bacterium]
MEVTSYNYNYANFVPMPDRRKRNIPVDVDKRSGVDRRQVPRYILAPGQDVPSVDPNTQFVQQADRRKQNVTVDVDKRAGVDRRQEARFIPLSFNGALVTQNNVFIGNVLENNQALKDFRSNFNNNTVNKLNQPECDTFNYSDKTKNINTNNLDKPPPANQSRTTEIKQNIIDFLAGSLVVLKKTAEAFAAIVTITAGIEAMIKLLA